MTLHLLQSTVQGRHPWLSKLRFPWIKYLCKYIFVRTLSMSGAKIREAYLRETHDLGKITITWQMFLVLLSSFSVLFFRFLVCLHFQTESVRVYNILESEWFMPSSGKFLNPKREKSYYKKLLVLITHPKKYIVKIVTKCKKE